LELSSRKLQKLGFDTQTSPTGDEADFAPTRLKSYQQTHQLTRLVQTGIPDLDQTDTKGVAVSQKDRLLRENARKTNNKQQPGLLNFSNCRHPNELDAIRRSESSEEEMEINIHEDLHAFWKRDRREHDGLAMCDTMQDEVLSPASRRRTDLFDWSSSASDIPQEIVEGIPASQEDFVRSLGATRRRIKHDEEVPDEVYGDTSTEETSPSQPTMTTGRDVPAGPVNPFHIGWEKNKIWTPMTGWINVGGSSSSEPTSPPPNNFRDRPGDISVGPRGIVEPAETEGNFNANTNIKDLKVEYSAYDHYIQQALEHKAQTEGAIKKRRETRGKRGPDKATTTRRPPRELA
jgi:hypothetical protein